MKKWIEKAFRNRTELNFDLYDFLESMQADKNLNRFRRADVKKAIKTHLYECGKFEIK